ncbi:hypothetical protein WR25_03599 [Diploscapter pachys]|uniref:Uncharacterized protein n=1 Tax=Diploscapter pachys TaxID=2018661 RepID=A0A2A2M5L8_9BILA|nr:hypothetical protein WR25_03599 [Diploscapter pachys]
MPCRPSSPIAVHSSAFGNQSSASILTASGAIRSVAKRCVESRIMSAASPRAKSKSGVTSAPYIFAPLLPQARAAGKIDSGRGDV